jgi:hypothetical protein
MPNKYLGFSLTKAQAALATLWSYITGNAAIPSGRTVPDLPTYLRNNAVYNVRDFGLVGDGVTDNSNAWDALYALLPERGAVEVVFPENPTDSANAVYYFSRPIALAKPITMSGRVPTWQALDAYRGVTLLFAAGSHGVILDSYDTRNGIAIANDFTKTGFNAGTIRNLRILAAGKTTTAHGLWARARFFAINVEVTGFKGNGVRIHANSFDPLIKGNANSFYCDRVFASGTDGDSWWIEGADVNAGTTINCSGGGCAGYAMYENSFLGNTHLGLHLDNTGGSGKHLWSGGAVSSNVFIGLYTEGNVSDSGAFIAAPTTIIGGLGASDSAIARAALGSIQLGPAFKGGPPQWNNAVVTAALGLQGINESTVLRFGATTDEGGTVHQLKYDAASGFWYLQFAGQLGFAPLAFPSGAAAMASIRARASWLQNGVFLGGPGAFASARHIGITATNLAPTTGDWIRGDIKYNADPVASGYVGWVCVTSAVGGNGGTWKQFGAITA